MYTALRGHRPIATGGRSTPPISTHKNKKESALRCSEANRGNDRMPISSKARRAVIARVVASIEAQQEAKPGYQQDVLESLVNSELKDLERAMGQSLDAIATGGIE